MRIKLALPCALVALALPAAAAAEPVQVNYEASLIHVALPTNSPCVFDDVRVDVLDFIDPLLQDGIVTSVARYNGCTGEFYFIRSPLLAPYPISEDAFVVSENGKRGDLEVVLPYWDSGTQSSSDVLLDLRWNEKHQALGEAEVKGWIKGPDFSIHLAPSIDWLRWGSPEFPWAGFWFCSFGEGEPGCIGQ